MRFRRALPWLAGIAALIVLPLYGYKLWIKTDYSDFDVYYRASERLQAGDFASIYNLSDGSSPFRYSPLTLPLFYPWAWLNHSTARISWYLLQWAALALSLIILKRVVDQVDPERKRRAHPPSDWILPLVFLMILRFCLDSFTIGQVSIIQLASLAVVLHAWTFRRPLAFGMATLIPTVLKVGPGVLYGLLLNTRGRLRVRAILGTFIGILVPTALITLWVGGPSVFSQLCEGWFVIMSQDGALFDSAHYANQSIRGALLRFSDLGFYLRSVSEKIWFGITALLSLMVIAYWTLRTATTTRARGLMMCLGVFLVLLVMPQTFKFNYVFLALPIALLLVGPLDRLTQAALVTVTLTLSIAGLDILGSKLFFGLQHASAPLIATLFLTYATLKVLSRETIRSSRLDALERIFATAHPWNIVPNRTSSTDLTLVIPVLESRDSIVSVERIDRLAREHLAELQKLNPQAQAELLLISFGELQSEFHPVRVWAKKLEAEFSQVSHLESRARKTPGLLYQRAFLRARGRWVAFINAEQPADPSWVTQAWKQAQSTPELGLIRANRRLSESVLEFAPQSRGLTESRTRQSLAINRGIRRLFGIQSTDLHSGTFLVRRDLAEIAFALQASVGQLFDLELSLIARNHAFQEMSLPSRFQVIGEYRGRRVIAEIARFFIQIPRVAWRLSQGYYSPQNIQAVFAADDWGMSPGINRGMLELARAGVLKQVSMMANSRHLESQIEELKSFKSTHPDFKCGLHFNLTYGKSLADPAHALQSFGRTTLTFALERLTGGDQLKNWVRSELTAQIDRLESLGFKPDFIDGHHHAHLIPGVLEATSDILNARGIRRVRLPYDRGLWLSPRMALNLLAMRARPLFKKNHWEYLNFFYPSAQLLQDQGKFRARLSRLGISEVIVHPAAFADWSQFEQKDPYLDGRIDEFKALRQLAFSQTDPSRPPQAT